MSMTLEELIEVLQHKNIRNIDTHNPNMYQSGFFDRIKCFIIDGKYYEIEWYCNGCYLKHENIIVPFKYIKQSNTWPTSSKMNLQFYDLNHAICCIIKIESWPKKDKL